MSLIEFTLIHAVQIGEDQRVFRSPKISGKNSFLNIATSSEKR
jgi:hypothetical protein